MSNFVHHPRRYLVAAQKFTGIIAFRVVVCELLCFCQLCTEQAVIPRTR